MRHRVISACLDLDSEVGIMIQDEVREDIVDDFVWRLAEEVEIWVDIAVECVGQIVFVERVVIIARELFYIIGVLRLLREMGLLVSGVVTRSRRAFTGFVLLGLIGCIYLPFLSRRVAVFIVG